MDTSASLVGGPPSAALSGSPHEPVPVPLAALSGDYSAQHLDDKWIGLILAMSSSIMIGTSFIITKKGLIDASKNSGHAPGASVADTHGYLTNALWWMGMATMVVGEIANFAAYSFAPAILVTPLGALSVIFGAILASIFLGEKMGSEGVIGCALCIIGSIIIILHAPEEKVVNSVDEILQYAVQPAFLVYCILVVTSTLVLIYKVAPIYGKKNMLVYISICSLVGSITVMASKGFGIALKLTFAGNNQLLYPSTYVFAIVVGVAVVTQMNYFNKALDIFSTNIVTPVYYVLFTTATIVASVILFQGFNDATTVQVISVFCGFITIFVGVFLLNTSRYHQQAASHNPLLDKPANGSHPQRRSASRDEAIGHVPNSRTIPIDDNADDSLLLQTFPSDDEEMEEDGSQ
ncbi:magnesium transporter NIPA-domain-containing protein [Hyaloraphidium curvatum]|nr:magnesium transporter NIPA-domain-containing protein [Hyaloraphidium curvatum]